MLELPILVLFLGLCFYLEEFSSSNPSILRAAVFATAAIEATLSLALRA